MKKVKNELKSVKLTTEQAETVREFIIDSMKDAYTDRGENPVEAFYAAAGKIADKIIKNVQMSLVQVNVFKKIVKNSKPVKKAVKKTK